MEVEGWGLLFHDAILGQLARLTAATQRAMAADPKGWPRNDNVRVLAAIAKLTLQDISRQPGDPKYRQDETLGEEYRHWFRAKFHQRFRLFFRYDSRARLIVYAWVNDEHTLRKAGVTSDPYRRFRAMLQSGNPPDAWSQLVKTAKGLPPDLRTLLERVR